MVGAVGARHSVVVVTPDDAPEQARPPAEVGDHITLRVGDLVAGGSAMGRDDEGRVVLVTGALPGELVEVAVTQRRQRMLAGDTVRVVESSPHRVAPVCAMVAAGCGGCDLQYAGPSAQPDMKVGIVTDALRHLGRLPDATVVAGPTLPSQGFRTTIRAAVDATGRAGFRRARSHESVAPDWCAVAHPLINEVLVDGRFPGASEVVVRASVATGERLVVVTPADGVTVGRVTTDVRVPGDVVVAGPDGCHNGTSVALWETVAGRSWRVSARSFFQTRPDGAEVLARIVGDGVDQAVHAGADPSGLLVDAYAGVGFLAGVLRGRGWSGPMVAVERLGDATADALVNLASDDVAVITAAVEKWEPPAASVVVADPARSGLGQAGIEVVTATGAVGIVLVSCDAASLGRDAGLLAARGFVHQQSVVVDMFAHTHHVEVVSTFVR